MSTSNSIADPSPALRLPRELVERPGTRLAPILYGVIRDDPNLTQREIAVRMGVSVASVEHAVAVLVGGGWITRRRKGPKAPPFGFPREST